jgi:2-keto-3-deoxy-L-rhamnonate aldolase RhmA
MNVLDAEATITPLSLRERWDGGATTLGAWLFLREPFTAEAASDAGYDYVCIDMQHGLADYRDMVAMVQALSRTPATPIVRVAGNEPTTIGRIHDALATILDACRRHSVVAGIQASSALAETRAKQGFQMITVGYDQAAVVAALRADLAASRSAVPPALRHGSFGPGPA